MEKLGRSIIVLTVITVWSGDTKMEGKEKRDSCKGKIVPVAQKNKGNEFSSRLGDKSFSLLYAILERKN